jgi:hypothetical protein
MGPYPDKRLPVVALLCSTLALAACAGGGTSVSPPTPSDGARPQARSNAGPSLDAPSVRGAGRTSTVEVTGVGDNAQAAKEDAIRNAVQAVVGSYVSSDLAMQDRQLVKDQVLSYSAGYVSKLDVLSQERESSGLYRIRVRAEVSREKVKRKLDELHVATNVVDGDSLFAESLSAVERRDNSRRVVTAVLERYPQSAFVAKVGKPSITAASGEKTRVAIPYGIAWDQAYLEELHAALVGVGGQKRTLAAGCRNLVAFPFGLKDVCLDANPAAAELVWDRLLQPFASTSHGAYYVPVEVTITDAAGTVLARSKRSAEVGNGTLSQGHLLISPPSIYTASTLACTREMELASSQLAKAAKVLVEVMPMERGGWVDQCELGPKLTTFLGK